MSFDFFREPESYPGKEEKASPLMPEHTNKEVDLIGEDSRERKTSKGAELAKKLSEQDAIAAGETKSTPKSADAKTDKQQSESPKLTKSELKKLAAKFGDQTYELPGEAKFRHKVDKEEVEVSLDELLNNYSGKQAWDKKFTELGLEKKKYQDDMNVVNKYVSEFAELSKKNKVAGLMHLAQAVGIDPLEYKRGLRNDFIAEYGPYAKLSEEERFLHQQKEELEYYKNLQAAQRLESQKAQTQQERNKAFENLKQSQGIDNARLEYLATELQQNFKLDVTPENVSELHTALVRLDRVDAALKAIDESFLLDVDKVTQLENLLRGKPNMTDAQLAKTAEKLFGDESEVALKKLAQKAESSKPAKAKEPISNLSHNKVMHGNAFNFFEN